jgi:threonine-phosphate decarboxylase
MIIGHGGNIFALAEKLGCPPGDIIDMSSNINPLGPMPGIMTYLKENLSDLEVLPEADAGGLILRFSAQYGIDPERVLAGSGTTQFIYALPMALDARQTLILGPTYADYADACRMVDTVCHWEIASEETAFVPDLDSLAAKIPGMDLVFICNANNPTGRLIPGSDLDAICRAHPQTVFVIDESYLPFVPEAENETMLNRPLPNVVVLHSMSKIYKIPGLRLGFLVGPEKIIEKLRKYQLPWGVNALAQTAAHFLFDEKRAADAFVQETRTFIRAEMQHFFNSLRGHGLLKAYPSTTTFLLVKLPASLRAGQVCDIFSRKKILLRNCANFHGLSDRFIRIALKNPQINRRVAEELQTLFCEPEA